MKPVTTLTFLIVGIATASALCWDRLAHSVTKIPKPGEGALALLVWSASVATVLAFAVLEGRRDRARGIGGRSIAELVALVAALVYAFGVFGLRWPAWPKLFNTDLEVVGLTYIIATVSFSSAYVKAVLARRAGAIGQSRVNYAVSGLALAVVLLTSSAILYLE